MLRGTAFRLSPPLTVWYCRCGRADGRDFTKYLMVATTEGGEAASPVTCERRFSEVKRFHDDFVAPVMSLDQPVLLPPDTDIMAAAAKNDHDVVTSRREAIQVPPISEHTPFSANADL